MFISDAYGETPAATATTTATTTTPVDTTVPEAPSPFAGMGVLLIIPVVLYFMMIRPNQRKIKEYEEMTKALKRGDRVVTGGGIVGVISKIENDEILVVEIAPDVKVRVMRETISHVITKQAVNDNKADEKAKKSDDKVSSS